MTLSHPPPTEAVPIASYTDLGTGGKQSPFIHLIIQIQELKTPKNLVEDSYEFSACVSR